MRLTKTTFWRIPAAAIALVVLHEIDGVSHWIPLDEPDRLSELIPVYYDRA